MVLYFAHQYYFVYCRLFLQFNRAIFNTKFDVRLHQIRLRPGLRPGPCWGSLRRSPRPPSRTCSGASRPQFGNLILQFSILNWMSDCTKFVCGRGSAPDPAGGAYDAPPDPLVGLVRALRALTSRASHVRLALRACMRTSNPSPP